MYTSGSTQPTAADIIPVRRLAFNPATGTHEVRAPTVKFIKGPIPLEWISRANALPGKAGAVGVALWFLAGVQKSSSVKLTGEAAQIAGCARKAIYQALRSLEVAGLVTVQRRRGGRPSVEIHTAAPNSAPPRNIPPDP
jgi:hypothetical protein